MNIFGIRFKILIFSLTISFLPIVCLSYLAFYYAKNSTEDMITSHLVSIADLKKRELVSWVNEKIEETIILGNYPDLQAYISNPSITKIPDHLREMAKLSKWESISLVKNDEVIVSTNPNALHSSIMKNIESKKLIEGEVFISDHYFSTNNTPTISFITPIPKNSRPWLEKTTFLIIEVNLNAEVLPLINNWPGMGYSGETLIAKQDADDIVFINKLRHRQDSEQSLRIERTSQNALPAIFASSGNEGVIRTTDYRGEEVLAVYRYIAQLDWGFVAKIDQNEAFTPIKRLQNNAVVATVIILIFVSVISAMIANSIVHPLSYLEQMAKRFARGDFSARIDTDAKGEIGSLAKTLEKMKEDLAQLQEEALRNEKLAAIGKLSGSVAHDIRNPLGAISNSIYFLNVISQKIENEQLDKHLALMHSEIGRVNSIIDDLMDFSRENEPQMKRNDINDLLEKVLNKTDGLREISCTTDFDERINPFLFDEVQMQRVFINLINNGLQAMENGGELQIVTELKTNLVEVRVYDNGTGITKEALNHVFEPLFTTKSKGVGLGLSITKTFVEKHNGQIIVESAPGEGTVFTVSLPYLTSF